MPEEDCNNFDFDACSQILYFFSKRLFLIQKRKEYLVDSFNVEDIMNCTDSFGTYS